MSKTLFIDTSKCMGCRGCESACKQWNDLKADIQPYRGNYQTKTDFAHQTYTFVRMEEVATDDGGVKWLFGKRQCMHCTEATCEMVCPVDAITRTPEGALNLDQEKCTGCGYCVQNCPFGVPKLDYKEQGVGIWKKKAAKCNMCADRVAEGMIPACAKTCPPGAIKFGEREELLALAKERLGKIQPLFPKAQIYGETQVGGTVLYLLTDDPALYGLPTAVSVPWQVKLWKNFARPVGEVALGGGLLVILAGLFFNYVMPAKETPHHVEGVK
ncbi:MAG: 4Fe-4S dicluster domain-containing protein [Chitinophagales bacterium]